MPHHPPTGRPSPAHRRTPAPAPQGARRRRLLLILALLLVAATACSGDDAGGAESAVDEDAAAPAPAAEPEAGDAADDGGAGEPQGGFAPGGAAEDGGEQEAREDAAPGDDEGADAATGGTSSSPLASTGERIIKEGTVTLEVEPGQFDAAYNQVVDRATALGGHVSGSSSATSPAPGGEEEDDRLISGQVTLRVPVQAFEDLLTAVGQAGEVTQRDISSQDVTAEYTDLESRRRNLQAQERFYLGLLEEATSIQDAIAIQQQLEDLQGRIEELTGRLQLLEDRSAFSTLTVRIHEAGATAPELADESEPGGLTPYLLEAGDVLVATVGVLILVVTFLLPFAGLGLLGFLVWRASRRRRAAAAATAGPAPAAGPARPAGPPPGHPGGPSAGHPAGPPAPQVPEAAGTGPAERT